MKAMIFAAGLGTRLKPITDNIPKALVTVNGIPLLEHVIIKLAFSGFNEIIVNTHHFHEKIINFLQEKKYFGIQIKISDESDKLLDTGGGLKKASWFFSDNKPFLVYNVDVISDIDLNNLYYSHICSNAIATIAVRERQTQRYFLFNENMNLCGWKNLKTNEQIISRNSSENLIPLAFSGIHVINPRIFELIHEEGKFSMTDIYLRLSTYHEIIGYQHNSGFWFDLGKPENISEAENILKRNDSFNE